MDIPDKIQFTIKGIRYTWETNINCELCDITKTENLSHILLRFSIY